MSGLKAEDYNPALKYGATIDVGTSIEIVDDQSFKDNNGNEVVEFGVVDSAVNNLKITNAIAGNPPKLEAVGGDANINVEITPKGEGYTVLRKGATSHVGTVVPQIFPDIGDIQAGAGAISVASYYTKVTTVGAVAITLASGTVLGQLKEIHMTVDGGDAVLTANVDGDPAGTITFADAGDRALLQWAGVTWVPIRLDNIADGVSAPVLSVV